MFCEESYKPDNLKKGNDDISGLFLGTYAEGVLNSSYVPAWRFGVIVSSGRVTQEDFRLRLNDG